MSAVIDDGGTVMTLSSDARARLDAHLDAIERQLKGCDPPVTRERRRAVVDDVETQVLEMLAARSEAPSVADVDGVLAQLDPPEAYGRPEGSAEAPSSVRPVREAPLVVPAGPHYSRLAIAGTACIGASFLMVVALLALGSVQTVHHRGPAAGPERSTQGIGMLGACVLLPLAALALVGTVLGWIAFLQIRSSGGRLHGTFLALFDGLFYPVILVVLIAGYVA